MDRLRGPCAKWNVRCVLSHVWFFVTPWSVASQAPLSMELSRQEYWSGQIQYDFSYMSYLNHHHHHQQQQYTEAQNKLTDTKYSLVFPRGGGSWDVCGRNGWTGSKIKKVKKKCLCSNEVNSNCSVLPCVWNDLLPLFMLKIGW